MKDGLKGLNITFEESSSLVRGLDYYQDTVFEFVHTGETLGVQQATVLAGGRYEETWQDLIVSHKHMKKI